MKYLLLLFLVVLTISAQAADLSIVDSINRRVHSMIKYKSDGKIDLWQSPTETSLKRTGDCEDFAILKYYLLKNKGIEARIAYVMYGQVPHMVAVAILDQAYILDNLQNTIQLSTERIDLDFYFTFNEDETFNELTNIPAAHIFDRKLRSILN